MIINKPPQQIISLPSLLRPHRNTTIDSIRKFFSISRMEGNTAILHERRSSSELGEDENSMLPSLTCDVLETDEIHAISHRGKETCISDRIEGS